MIALICMIRDIVSGCRMGTVQRGNGHLRKLLVEAVGGICKGTVGHKSKELRARQRKSLEKLDFIPRCGYTYLIINYE